MLDMHLELIRLNDLRNLREVEFRPGEGVNLFYGGNGAGKTSVLEGIHMLGTGRSFRYREHRPVIRVGAHEAQAYGEWRAEGGVIQRLGVGRRASEYEVRLNGQALHRRSELLAELPLLVFSPASHGMLEGAAEQRRNWLDLGLFHVEHEHLQRLAEYNRALRQRNAALKISGSDLRPWNRLLASFGEAVATARVGFAQGLMAAHGEMLEQLVPGLAISTTLWGGWAADTTLADALEATEGRDRKFGHTGVGPHRGDLVFKAEGEDATRVLSRGQQKLVGIALVLAMRKLLSAALERWPLLLLDDLPAELDGMARGRVIEAIRGQGGQAFVTAIEAGSLDIPKGSRWFHVEQGRVTEASGTGV